MCIRNWRLLANSFSILFPFWVYPFSRIYSTCMRLQPFKLTRNPIVFEFILFCLAVKRHCLITLIFSFKEGLQRHRLFSSRVSPAPPPVREFKHHLNEKNSCLFGMDKTLVSRKTLATSSVDAVIATTGEDPNSMLAISEIDQFLSQVDRKSVV